nr:15693_t:CDS:2 [Entrophospora candida]
MSVSLDPPNQLAFSRPFTQNVTRTLSVKNPNPEPIAFKVKTTAPKQYCVRPNSGRIEANQTVDVQVILQAMKEDPPVDFKCKDKFLVQSIPISPEQENLTLQELWATIEKQTKGSIKETKIRCVYLPPISTLDNTHQQPSSPDLPVNDVTNNNADPKDSDDSNTIAFDNNRSVSNDNNNTVKSHNNRDVQSRQLFEAQEEIKRLNHIIEEYKQETNLSKLRQRKVEQPLPNKNNTPSGIGISVKTQEKVPEGYYPFEVVNIY